jgi:tetratricopeptide (TPR) repeat protein
VADPQPDELNIAKARSDLSMALQTQSRYIEAEVLEQQALATDEKMLGAEHATTMAARRDLALSEYRLGHYAQAQAIMEQTLAAQRHKLGNDHPALAGTEINLGGLLVERGAADAAELVLIEAVAIFEKKYGPDYQGVVMALGNLAAAHIAMGKLDAAAAELDKVAAHEEKDGQGDKDRALTLIRLGELQRSRGNLSAAVELHRRAVAGTREKHGENHRFTANAHQQLALSLRDSGDAQGAEQEFRAALASYAGYLPNGEHPMAATTSYELGRLLLRASATRAEGLRLLDSALTIREKFLGANDPATREARAALEAAQGSAKT